MLVKCGAIIIELVCGPKTRSGASVLNIGGGTTQIAQLLRDPGKLFKCTQIVQLSSCSQFRLLKHSGSC